MATDMLGPAVGAGGQRSTEKPELEFVCFVSLQGSPKYSYDKAVPTYLLVESANPVRRPGFRRPVREPGHPKLLVLLSCWGSSAVDGSYLQKDRKKAYPNDSVDTSPKTSQTR